MSEFSAPTLYEIYKTLHFCLVLAAICYVGMELRRCSSKIVKLSPKETVMFNQMHYQVQQSMVRRTLHKYGMEHVAYTPPLEEDTRSPQDRVPEDTQ